MFETVSCPISRVRSTWVGAPGHPGVDRQRPGQHAVRFGLRGRASQPGAVGHRLIARVRGQRGVPLMRPRVVGLPELVPGLFVASDERTQDYRADPDRDRPAVLGRQDHAGRPAGNRGIGRTRFSHREASSPRARRARLWGPSRPRRPARPRSPGRSAAGVRDYPRGRRLSRPAVRARPPAAP